MPIPVEPNLDKPIPVAPHYSKGGKNMTERAKIAGNTALLLRELGLETSVSPEEDAKAKEMFAQMQVDPAQEDKDKKPGTNEVALKNVNVALKLGDYISEYEKQVIADKIQVRTIVVNRLMEISKDEDNKTALKALELLGKASDLFTERAEITITHRTSDELKAAIKERIAQLMQKQQIENKTKTETRLSQLTKPNEVVDAEVKEVK